MTIPDPGDSMDFLDDEDEICPACNCDPCECGDDDDDGFYGETLAERNPSL